MAVLQEKTVKKTSLESWDRPGDYTELTQKQPDFDEMRRIATMLLFEDIKRISERLKSKWTRRKDRLVLSRLLAYECSVLANLLRGAGEPKEAIDEWLKQLESSLPKKYYEKVVKKFRRNVKK